MINFCAIPLLLLPIMLSCSIIRSYDTINGERQGSINKVVSDTVEDTIKVSSFRGSRHILAKVFEKAENKIVLFDESDVFDVDYAFFIPTCKILGNNSTIRIGAVVEHSAVGDCIKIRNKHYDGKGEDSFTIENLNFETSTDRTFLFSIMNARDVTLRGCSFFSYSKETPTCIHSLDLRGNIHNITIEDCKFVNMTGAKSGGCLWLRSFGDITNVLISRCSFYNNTTDEVLSLIAITGCIQDVSVDNSYFDYKRDAYCPFPNVFWSIVNRKNQYIKNVSFSENSIKSNFVPSFVINSNSVYPIVVENNKFTFKDFLMHESHLVTTMFRGPIEFLNNEVSIVNLSQDSDPDSQINLFSGNVVVKKSLIRNNCSKIHLGNPLLYNSKIIFDNSQLFNGSLPMEMIGNYIVLGKGTPNLAANPFSQKKQCLWEDNIIEGEKSVVFHFAYKNLNIKSRGNSLKNINIEGKKIN